LAEDHPALRSITQQAADAIGEEREWIATCRATTGLHVACMWRAAADIKKGGCAVSQFMR
jgi:hypothetical protein